MWKYIFKTPKKPTKSYEQKINNTFEERHREALEMLKKDSSRIPVIIEKDYHSNIPNLKKTKFLIPRSATVAQMIIILRKNIIKLDPSQSLIMFVGNEIPHPTKMFGELYDNHKDPDEFLYCKLSVNQSFG